MTAAASEAMQAPDSGERLCPSCRQPLSAFAELPAGGVPKCPVHGLAFIEQRELAQSGGDSLLGTTIAGRFTVLGRLGRGSMGAVYRARQEAVGRDVALKIVRRDRAYDPETKARFEREARAISSLRSPHAITAFDFGESQDGSWFLAMEMLDGETVGDRLRREGRIDWVDAVRFACDALKALSEAHGKGIIHRDLKPDNLFLVRLPEGRELCKVLDFGIAKWQSGSEAPIDQLETQAGTVFGTPRYMSPEQAQGNALDARSDLYSLGVLLYQMLSGQAPFTDDDAVVVMARHIKDEPPLFSELAAGSKVPLAIERVVRRALRKAPAERPQSAEEMAASLEGAAELARAQTSGAQAVPPVAVSAAHEILPVKRRPRVWVLAAGVGLLAIIASTWLLTGKRAPSAVEGPTATEPAIESIHGASEPSAEHSGEAAAPTANVADEPNVVAAATDPVPTTSSEISAVTSTLPLAPGRPGRVRPPAPASSSTRGLKHKPNERYGRFE